MNPLYNKNLAEKYWSQRAIEKPTLDGVLNVGLPTYANEAFDQWFTTLLKKWVKSGTKVLDIGCGIGRVLIPLAKGGCKVTGIDISPEMINQCRKEARKHHLTKNMRLDIGSVDELPYKKESFDVVMLSEILFHLTDDLVDKAIEEASRVLKPGGFIIATANNRNSIFLKKFSTNKSVQRRDGYFFTVRDLKEINSRFESHNLKLIFSKGFTFTSILNNLKNGTTIFSKVYRKVMFKFPYPLIPFYKVFSLIDSNKRINLFDNNLAVLFFLVYTNK